MSEQLYNLPLVASLPDQAMTVGFNGNYFVVRVFYATTTKIWWMEISDPYMGVTLSQIALRPGVMHGLSGKLPGYAGRASVGMLTKRGNAVYGSIDAFAGDFGLYVSDGGDTVTNGE